MGVSLEVYRSRIGSFGCRIRLQSGGVVSCNDGFKKMLFVAAVIFALLLIGGIEPNPGPDGFEHKCRVCESVFHSAVLYCKHVVLHPRYHKQKGIPCSVPNCHAIITTVDSYRSHIALYHGNRRANAPSASDSCLVRRVSCPVQNCPDTMKTRSDYTSHMRGHLSEGQSFKCILKGCSGTLMKKPDQFYSHNCRYHPKEKGIDESAEVHQLIHQVTADASITESPSITDNYDAMDFDKSDDDVPASSSENVQGDTQDDDEDSELYPLHAIKDEVARFYLRLEACELLPTTTVQIIAEEIKLLSEVMHHILKNNLKKELEKQDLEPHVIKDIVRETFMSEPVFNIHHYGRDLIQLGTNHLRMSYWGDRFKFIEPTEIYFGQSDSGKKKSAQFVSVRKSLEALLKDNKVKDAVLKSFDQPTTSPAERTMDTIFKDFTDGEVFRNHVRCPEHEGKKCVQLFLFQDAFDPNAFSSGSYKPLGFYYTIGNLPQTVRARLDLIQMAFMALETDLKNSLAEELKDFDRLSDALEPLIKDLIDLKQNGIEINGEVFEVCLLFLIGDSLGQNFIGRFVTNFSSSAFSCRFCTMSKDDFHENPELTRQERTVEQYNNYMNSSKNKWLQRKRHSVKVAKAKAAKAASKCRAPAKKTSMRDAISRDAFKKLLAINFRGVKYRPSPFNRAELQFHVVDHQPPCLAHDLFEGIVKKVVAEILKYFIQKKKWFDLATLNKRIKSFKCKGSDADDRPKPLKTLDKLGGNAIENWNFLRLAPFMFGDLIKDPKDPYWKMFLLLRVIVEYVCAYRITFGQIGHLSTLITEFILLVKEHLSSCLIPKLHYLCHYPGLIIKFGPLMALFSLRFESKHSFFKRVIRSCKNHINLPYTMARKYMCRFAYDAIARTDDYEYGDLGRINYESMSEELKRCLRRSGQLQEMEKVKYCGTTYTVGSYLILGELDGQGMKVGVISKIVTGLSGGASLVVEEMRAEKESKLGIYIIQKNLQTFRLLTIEELPDHYPLQSYKFQGKDCIALKHRVPFIF